MKSFDLQLFEDLELKQVTLDEGRYYETDDGIKLDSVTTLLGRIPSKKAGLDKWRKRVGHAEANAIGNAASARGTIIHDSLEKYILGEDDYMPRFPIHSEIVRHFQHHLDRSLGTIWGVEKRLYSKVMRTAGTADLVCEWNDIPSIVDFKTSKRHKKWEYITDYLLQSTCYAIMMEELYGMIINQIVILIYVDDDVVTPWTKQLTPHWKEQTAAVFKGLAKLG